MRVVKILTVAAWVLCGIVVFLAMPAHPIVPDYLLARVAFVVVPVLFIGSVVWIGWAIFSKAPK